MEDLKEKEEWPTSSGQDCVLKHSTILILRTSHPSRQRSWHREKSIAPLRCISFQLNKLYDESASSFADNQYGVVNLPAKEDASSRPPGSIHILCCYPPVQQIPSVDSISSLTSSVSKYFSLYNQQRRLSS